MLAANRLDKTNLTATQVVLFLAALFVVVDYVRRLNVYREAYFPLPVPSAWADALTERPAVASHPDKPRLSLIEELQFITRRGEVFIHFTCEPSVADQVSTELPRLRRSLADTGGGLEQEDGLDDRFVFETLWFGRNSFVLQDRSVQSNCWKDLCTGLACDETSRLGHEGRCIWFGTLILKCPSH